MRCEFKLETLSLKFKKFSTLVIVDVVRVGREVLDLVLRPWPPEEFGRCPEVGRELRAGVGSSIEGRDLVLVFAGLLVDHLARLLLVELTKVELVGWSLSTADGHGGVAVHDVGPLLHLVRTHAPAADARRHVQAGVPAEAAAVGAPADAVRSWAASWYEGWPANEGLEEGSRLLLLLWRVVVRRLRVLRAIQVRLRAWQVLVRLRVHPGLVVAEVLLGAEVGHDRRWLPPANGLPLPVGPQGEDAGAADGLVGVYRREKDEGGQATY